MPLHVNKPALRILGIAESFARTFPVSVLAGVVMRADMRIDGMAYAHATVGGDDATQAVIRIYEKLDREDVNALLISGAAVSWFNIIDLQEVFRFVKRPIVSLTYEASLGLERYLREYFPQSEDKLRSYQRLGNREVVRLKTGHEVYVRAFGATAEEARNMLNKFTKDGRIPEPVRVARLAARAALHVDNAI
ncbi:MAG: DUF99 family protein [Methanothrix sp.]|nr:DUF99 family protein [Methanothrix sp.]